MVTLKIDDKFLSKLGVDKNDTVGLVVEVKGGREKARVKNSKYAKSFFGNISPIKK